jgi:Icc-related predicted phosphoesterase
VRVESIDPEPFHAFPYLNAKSGGGTMTVSCPLFRAWVDRLPRDVDALVLTSDLQGVVGDRLLGEGLVSELARLADKKTIPSLDRIGVVLAGDLYSAPEADRRGATGDVTSVWRAFSERFAFVVGVAGNHDLIDGAVVARMRGAVLLDGDVVDLGGVRFGGVSGIVGKSKKNRRRSEHDFLAALDTVLERGADVVVVHEGPDGEGGALRGNPVVRTHLEERAKLVVAGHAHWPVPLATLGRTGHVLNVDGRAIVATRR